MGKGKKPTTVVKKPTAAEIKAMGKAKPPTVISAYVPKTNTETTKKNKVGVKTFEEIIKLGISSGLEFRNGEFLGPNKEHFNSLLHKSKPKSEEAPKRRTKISIDGWEGPSELFSSVDSKGNVNISFMLGKTNNQFRAAIGILSHSLYEKLRRDCKNPDCDWSIHCDECKAATRKAVESNKELVTLLNYGPEGKAPKGNTFSDYKAKYPDALERIMSQLESYIILYHSRNPGNSGGVYGLIDMFAHIFEPRDVQKFMTPIIQKVVKYEEQENRIMYLSCLNPLFGHLVDEREMNMCKAMEKHLIEISYVINDIITKNNLMDIFV